MTITEREKVIATNIPQSARVKKSRHRPVARTAGRYQFPSFDRRVLPNGMRLVTAPVSKLPIVTLLMIVEGGAVTDPVDQDGLAQLTAKLLLEGTKTATGAEFASRVEQLGASIDAHADWDVSIARLTVLTEHIPAALRLFGDMLRAPAFLEREVNRLKAERLAELLQTEADPGALADQMFARFVYAPVSRFARPAGGLRQSVERITRDHVEHFWSGRYRPAEMTLVAVGDVSLQQVESLAGDIFGDWQGKPAAAVAPSDQFARLTRAIHVVAKVDAPQSELRIGHRGIPRTTPDYFPVVVMNAVLGGLFSSRINLNLREVHGYTYGAFSGFDWRRHAGPFGVETAVKTEVTDGAVQEVINEVDRIREEAILPEELSLATSYLEGVFPIRYETTDAIAAALGSLVIYRLPDDYFDTYRDRIRAITTADVLRVAQAHLHPEYLQVVAVGDPAIIRDPLQRLAMGPVTVYDVTGTPLS